MKLDHQYFTHPELFYKTQFTKVEFSNFNLTIEEIQDLDDCIDFQCQFLLSTPLPEPFIDINEDLCPYFAKIWECALSLAKWIDAHHYQFNQKKVLEIGAGLAIPSMVLAKLGHNVMAMDFHPHAAYFSNINQKINNLSFNFLEKNWSELGSAIKSFDIIIASDILYEGKFIADLIELLNNNLSENSLFILCDPIRGYLQKLISELELNFFIKLETLKHAEQEHFLVTIQRKPPAQLADG